MRVLVTGICGFAGSVIAKALVDALPDAEIFGIDNLSRAGSARNVAPLRAAGIAVTVGDIRSAADLDALPDPDWVIDAAANPSVLAGIDGAMASRAVVEHNLFGTINLLELCKRRRATFTLLSTSRVYAIAPLAELPMRVESAAFVPDPAEWPRGLGPDGLREDFSTAAPVSLYGATKLASETMAMEYGAAFGFPVWINRCGVLAGAGQFGKPDQGIFSYWIHSYRERRPLRYIGFGGHGHQVRDALHPRDLVGALVAQCEAGIGSDKPRVCHFAGGRTNSLSLRQLSDWCARRFGDRRPVEADSASRRFDLPWVVLDCGLAEETWNWRPATPIEAILDEIAAHAETEPDWIAVSAG